LAGRHARKSALDRWTGRHVRKSGVDRWIRHKPVYLSASGAILLAGVTAGALAFGGSGPHDAAAGAPAAALVLTPTPRLLDRPASRDEVRSPQPSLTPSVTPDPSRKSPASKQPSSSGSVVSSGSCQASFYGSGQHTANGERFDPTGYTAASKTLPFNTRVRVTNAANGKSVMVRINDRGPYVTGRCLDLTPTAFTAIASTGSGVIAVTYQVLA
jgi:rare lipoprotein A